MTGVACSLVGGQPVTTRSDQPQLRVFDPMREGSDEVAKAVPPLEGTAELLAELQEVSVRLETATPQEILGWVVDRFRGRFTMATAFGPEGMVLIHLLAEIAPDTPIFNLDTGYQFPETLELRERVLRRYGIAVEMKRPELNVAEYEAQHGGPVYRTNPDQCCYDRKIRVLHEAVRGMHAWASAIRRDQSPDRAQAAIVGWDKKFQLVKVSPLANWTKRQVWDLIVQHDIPYNPLHDQGYPSIGCQPCTRSILCGEDERAGRWSGFGEDRVRLALGAGLTSEHICEDGICLFGGDGVGRALRIG